MTFSALPDCLCARLPGSLSDVEAVVLLAQSGGISAAARQWRPDSLDFRGARRWVRRRVQLVEVELQLFQGLLPQLFAGLGLLLAAFGERLAAPDVLQELRRQGSAWLGWIPYPVGFDLRRRRSGSQTGPPTVDGPVYGASVRRR